MPGELPHMSFAKVVLLTTVAIMKGRRWLLFFFFNLAISILQLIFTDYYPCLKLVIRMSILLKLYSSCNFKMWLN